MHENESLWHWEDCENPIDFKDVWFAVRGVGGKLVLSPLPYNIRYLEGAPFNTLVQWNAVGSAESRIVRTTLTRWFI